MEEYSILEIPTVLSPPFELNHIDYNCPVCDFEIEINMIVEENSSIICDNCENKIRMEIKKI